MDISINFFKTVQNKMHWAITGKTAAEIIHTRANADKPNMGLTNYRGAKVRKQDFSKAGEPLKRHIYDYVITDSKIERTFVQELDIAEEVVVYAKLPKGFSIPTPVGNYNPDWAISFKEGAVKHVYFVAETKGTMSSMELREIEKIKIKCARKFFAEINGKIKPDIVRYDVVNSYGKLMEIVGVSQ